MLHKNAYDCSLLMVNYCVTYKLKEAHMVGQNHWSTLWLYHINLELAQNSRQAKQIDAPNDYAKDLSFTKITAIQLFGTVLGEI